MVFDFQTCLIRRILSLLFGNKMRCLKSKNGALAPMLMLVYKKKKIGQIERRAQNFHASTYGIPFNHNDLTKPNPDTLPKN